MTEKELRATIVREALTWRGTPYVIGGRVKGVGCDCATLLYETFRVVGLVPEEDIGIFSGDWFCHTTEEKYMLRILRHAFKTVEAVCYRSLAIEPGNIVMTKAADSKVYNHGGIVIQWPRVLHAMHPAVEVVDASRDSMWAYQGIASFDACAKVFATEKVC